MEAWVSARYCSKDGKFSPAVVKVVIRGGVCSSLVGDTKFGRIAEDVGVIDTGKWIGVHWSGIHLRKQVIEVG